MKSSAKLRITDPHSNATRRTLITALTIVGAMLVGGVFFLFDPARGGFYPTCLFHRLTGLNCPGCGALRALHHLTHGEIAAAFHCNPLLMVLLPFVALFGLRWLRHGRGGFDSNSIFFRPATLWTLLGVTLVFTILRNLPGPVFAWMSP